MRILIIADGRSPTTRRWIRVVSGLGHEVILASTFPCAPVEEVEADVCLPVAFAQLSGSASSAGAGGASRKGLLRSAVSAFRPLFLAGRYLLGPATLRFYGPRLRWLVQRLQPDLVHALRIPYEGMLAAWTPPGVPVAVSIWGNDLTLHANGSRAMANLTRRALQRADALLADTYRDIRMASGWGFDPRKLNLVVPGSGGLDLEALAPVRQKVARFGSSFDDIFDPALPLVINPRGFRTGSVRQDIFFQSLPLIIERHPGIQFACAAMAGQREALGWVERLHLQKSVTLLPHLPQDDLWELFARAELTVSVSEHDGTPNSLLEGMALGAFPVAGDIESIREWITPGVNGMLVEPSKPQGLSEAIMLALDSPELRARAFEHNAVMLRERASVERTRENIAALYEQLAALGEPMPG